MPSVARWLRAVPKTAVQPRRKVCVNIAWSGTACAPVSAYIYPRMQYLAASSRDSTGHIRPNFERADGRMNERTQPTPLSPSPSPSRSHFFSPLFLFLSFSSTISLSPFYSPCSRLFLSLFPSFSLSRILLSLPPSLSLSLSYSFHPSLCSFFCFITMSERVCVSVSLGSSCRCRRGWFLALCRVFISSE